MTTTEVNEYVKLSLKAHKKLCQSDGLTITTITRGLDPKGQLMTGWF